MLVCVQPTISDGRLAPVLAQQWGRGLVLWASPEEQTGEMISGNSLVGTHLMTATLRCLLQLYFAYCVLFVIFVICILSCVLRHNLFTIHLEEMQRALLLYVVISESPAVFQLLKLLIWIVKNEEFLLIWRDPLFVLYP